MTILIESLKRLYSSGEVTDEKIDQIEAGGKITPEEKAYIKEGESPIKEGESPSVDPDVEGLKTFHSEVMKMVGGGEDA